MRRPTTWSDDPDLNKILEVSNAQEKLWWLLMADAGCRLREALAFDVSSLGPPGLHIYATKTKKWRWVFVSDRLSDHIAQTSATRGYWSKPTPRTVQRRLAARCKEAKVKRLTPHHLRHSFATRCALAGIPIFGIQSLMGHESERVTRIYLHLDLEAFGLEMLKAQFDARLKRR